MKVTVLIENTTEKNLACEHGLSLYIEWNGKKILLDAGTTEAFYENAIKMDVSFADLDACVLSHGHYDHSGGFEAVFRGDEQVKVYAQKTVAGNFFSGKGNLHEIGVPENVLRHENRFHFVDRQMEIFKGMHLIPHSTPGLEQIGEKAKLYKGMADQLTPDDFAHEQSLVLETEQGLVIFNSCSHGGVKNIIREVKEACDGKRIYAYVGGLHMMGKKNGVEICSFSDSEVRALCDVIREEGIAYVYTGHCTGQVGLAKMQEQLGDVVRPMTTGLRFAL